MLLENVEVTILRLLNESNERNRNDALRIINDIRAHYGKEAYRPRIQYVIPSEPAERRRWMPKRAQFAKYSWVNK